MANIPQLQNAVKAAEDYLILVSQNMPCGGTCSGFTGAATVNEQFRIQREKDYVQGNKNLIAAKEALAAGIIENENEARKETINIPQNTNINQLGEQIKPESKGLILIAGLVAAALILK